MASPSIDLLSMFSPASTVSRAPVTLSTSSLAVVGPIPSSSLLHLALNHLRAAEEDDRSPAPVLSAKARGKQRAEEGELEEGGDAEEGGDDADFLGQAERELRRVLILTPDEGALRGELAKESDVSLFGARRDTATAKLLDLVDIRYLPTSAHLSYFLSTAYIFPSRHAPAARAAYDEAGAKSRIDPSCLSYEPTLIILHSPSDYLEESPNEGAGIEAYASILAHFVSTFTRLSLSSPTLVLFDPFAADASLPLLPLHLRSKGVTKKRSLDEGDAAPGAEMDRDRIPLKQLAARFFDYVGGVEEVPSDPSAVEPLRLLLSCEASPSLRAMLPKSQHRLGVEFLVHRVGQDDPEGEDEGGMRVEVVA